VDFSWFADRDGRFEELEVSEVLRERRRLPRTGAQLTIRAKFRKKKQQRNNGNKIGIIND
jgi:hypothetical protein